MLYYLYMGENEPSRTVEWGTIVGEKKLKPLFSLGQVVGTPGALDAMIEAEQNPAELLVRHVTGDWGDLDDADKEENELSVKEGFRILSAYELETGVKVWVITEWNRCVTTILLPDEY
jgi:hypothetical protein